LNFAIHIGGKGFSSTELKTTANGPMWKQVDLTSEQLTSINIKEVAKFNECL